MAKFVVKETELSTLRVISGGDSRDFLCDVDSVEYAQMGIEEQFVQHSVESYARGVLQVSTFPTRLPRVVCWQLSKAGLVL